MASQSASQADRCLTHEQWRQLIGLARTDEATLKIEAKHLHRTTHTKIKEAHDELLASNEARINILESLEPRPVRILQRTSTPAPQRSISLHSLSNLDLDATILSAPSQGGETPPREAPTKVATLPDLATIEAKLDELKALICSGNAEVKAIKASVATATQQTKEINSKVKTYAGAVGGARLPGGCREVLAPATSATSPLVRPPPPKKFKVEFYATGGERGYKATMDLFKSSCPFNGATMYSDPKWRNDRVEITLATQEARKETIEKINATGKFKAQEAKQLLPMMILKGISNDVPREELAERLKSGNTTLAPSTTESATGGELRVCFLRSNWRPDLYYNAVLEAAPEVVSAALALGRLHIGHQLVHVAPFSRLMQCSRCQHFGHIAAKCQEANSRPGGSHNSRPSREEAGKSASEAATTLAPEACAHCAGNHRLVDCPDKDDKGKLKCANCHEWNQTRTSASASWKKRATDHRATSSKCPSRLAVTARLNEMTAQ